MTECTACRCKKSRRIWMIAALLAVWIFSLVLTWRLFTRARFMPDTAFFGDSITEAWDLPSVNFGIFGSTTDHMVERFNAVLDGQFTRVVILGGTNDILKGEDLDKTASNLHEMIEAAIKARLKLVIVCTVPPIYSNGGKYQSRVDGLNAKIEKDVKDWQASGAQVILVDFNKPLRGRPDLYSVDGVHIRPRAYYLLERELLRKANLFWWQSGHRYPRPVGAPPPTSPSAYN